MQSRDFVYVTDVVQALRKAPEVPGISGRVYNIGTGASVTVVELVAALNRQLGTALAPLHGPTRAGDVRHSRADISRARRDQHRRENRLQHVHPVHGTTRAHVVTRSSGDQNKEGNVRLGQRHIGARARSRRQRHLGRARCAH